MTEPTPPPWTLFRTGHQSFDVNHPKGCTFLGIDPGSGAPDVLDPDDMAEFEANVRLIGVARELLEALKKCAEWMESTRASGDCGNWDWQDGDDYMLAAAVLAKAEGREP